VSNELQGEARDDVFCSLQLKQCASLESLEGVSSAGEFRTGRR
jgi:hypothetical protein